MNRIFYTLLLSLQLFAGSRLLAQGSSADNSLQQVLKNLENTYSIRISYNPQFVEGFIYEGSLLKNDLGVDLRQILNDKNLGFIALSADNYAVIPSAQLSREIAWISKLNLTWAEAQQATDSDPFTNGTRKYQFTGRVVDGRDNNRLPGVTIIFRDLEISTSTRQDGSFSMEVPGGKHSMSIHGLGFDPYEEVIILTGDTDRTISLFEKSQELNEVVIYSEQISEKVFGFGGSVERLSITAIKEMPAFMGEVDLVKSITSMPGVSVVGEGSNGFNVRGGRIDENLILLDGIPIFNSSHLFGFVSIFNPDIVSDFTLYKGGTTAALGGRSSSILNVNSRSGSQNTQEASVSLGTVTSKVTLEGPLADSRGSFLLSGRWGHPNWLLKKVKDPEISGSKASFSDLNLKLAGDLENDRRLELSTYLSNDKFALVGDTTFNWNFYGLSLTYRKLISSSLSYYVRGVTTGYINTIEGRHPSTEYDFTNNVKFSGVSFNFLNVRSNNSILEYGAELNHYLLRTGELSPTTSQSSINHFEPLPDVALEQVLFASWDQKFGTKISITAGLRLTGFLPKGSGQLFVYQNELNPDVLEVMDTLNTSSFETPYLGIEPRFNFGYSINEVSSLKGGFQSMRQNVHIISNSLSIAPTDFWKLSNSFVKPTVANQVHLGYYRNLRQKLFVAEVFYKRTKNILDYKSGTQVFLNPQIETSVINRLGESYGLELKLEKYGDLNGWISYSYLNSDLFSDAGFRLDDNFGNDRFPSDFNKPHNLNMVMNYKVSRRLSVSANFVFSSGRPITVAESAWSYFNSVFPNYTSRNEGKIPDYHRADISLTVKGNLKKKKLYDSDFVFSIYNLYGRKNAFSVFYSTTSSGILPQAYKLAILGSMFPSINYNIRFANVK